MRGAKHQKMGRAHRSYSINAHKYRSNSTVCSMHTIHVYKYRSNSTFGKLIYCTFLTRLQHWSWRREDGDFSFCSLRNWDTISIVSKDSVTSACPVLLSNTCNVEVYHHRRRQYCIYSGEKMFLLLFCFF